jgi:dolichol-phosphate mannosyltransferase
VGGSGVLLLFYIIVSWLSGKAVEGWTSLMVVVVTLMSAQLLVLGIMGEYIGRLYLEAKRRPLFVIDEAVGRSIWNEEPVASAIASSAERTPGIEGKTGQ